MMSLDGITPCFILIPQLKYLTGDIIMIFDTEYVRVCVIVGARIRRWGSVGYASNHNIFWEIALFAVSIPLFRQKFLGQ